MADSRGLTGHPWHVGYVTSNDEKRRDKRRCINYQKYGKYCGTLETICMGSSHCAFYEEKQEGKEYNQISNISRNCPPFAFNLEFIFQ